MQLGKVDLGTVCDYEYGVLWLQSITNKNKISKEAKWKKIKNFI